MSGNKINNAMWFQGGYLLHHFVNLESQPLTASRVASIFPR